MSLTQEQKLVATDAQAGDELGWSVALDGSTCVAGAYLENGMGAAYVFVRSGTIWTQQQKLVASDAEVDDYFGWSVAVSGDTIIVGAYGEDTGGLESGAAYIFTRTAGIWTQQQKLVASDALADSWFGWSVALYGDTAVVGANLENGGGADAGATYVFTRTAGVWAQQQKLVANDTSAGSQFGWSVALDGDTCVIGAYIEGLINAGAAYIFTRTAGVWAQQQKLVASDAVDDDWFGYDVDVENDICVIGARYYEGLTGHDTGAAYIFTRTAGVWTEQQKLVANDPQDFDEFGNSVSVSGHMCVVAAIYEDDGGNFAGSAYVFTYSDGVWTQQQKLLADDSQVGDSFGAGIDLNSDICVVGAAREDAGGIQAGALYIFTPLLRTGTDTMVLGDSGICQLLQKGLLIRPRADGTYSQWRRM